MSWSGSSLDTPIVNSLTRFLWKNKLRKCHENIRNSHEKIRPHRRCWGVIFRMALLNSASEKWKTLCFSTFWPQFFGLQHLFFGSAGGLARKRIFEFFDPFSAWFSSFCKSRNTGFYNVLLFSACLTASCKTSKNLVNYAVLCYGVTENIVNSNVFWLWLKNPVNYIYNSVFCHLTLKNHGICSGFYFSPRKNTVNNSNFAVFACFSLFFAFRWFAIHGYQILSLRVYILYIYIYVYNTGRCGKGKPDSHSQHFSHKPCLLSGMFCISM